MRFARPGETLLALNGHDYELDPEITVIADDNGVQSLGGVIGGEPTGCTEATTEVFIEAALFDPVRTAATGRRLDIVSDARYRFERGLDPAFVGAGPRDRDPADPRAVRRRAVRGRRRRRRAGLAARLSAARRADRRGSAGCMSRRRKPRQSSKRSAARSRPTADGDLCASTPPSWRGDIDGEADLVEEVLRVHGYDQIPAVPLPRETVDRRGRRSTRAAAAPSWCAARSPRAG